MPPGELRRQPGLPRAGLPADDDDPRPTVLPRGSELRGEPFELDVPIHELGADEGSRSPCRERGARRSGLVRHDRLRLALRQVRAPPSVADRVPRPTPGALFDQDGAGRGEIGQTRCRVDDVADHRDPGRLGGRPHHDLAGVDAGVDLGDREPGTSLVQLADAFADGEGRAHRPLGVVLVRDGNPEDGHEAISLDLRHGSPVILDHPLEVRQRRPYEGIDLLRVERRCEGRVPGEVREEQRDELALSTGLRHPTIRASVRLPCPPSPPACPRRPPGRREVARSPAPSSSMSSDPSSTNSGNRPMTQRRADERARSRTNFSDRLRGRSAASRSCGPGRSRRSADSVVWDPWAARARWCALTASVDSSDADAQHRTARCR